MVPFIGYLRLREGTSRLRSLLRPGSDFDGGRVLFVTISLVDGRWRLSLNLDVDARAITQRLRPSYARRPELPVVGCDLGIETLACLASPDGAFVQHSLAPEEVDRWRKTIRGHQRRLSIKRGASLKRAKEAHKKRRTVGVSEMRARVRHRRRFARQRKVRVANLQVLTSDIVGRCEAIAIEDLPIANLLQNHCVARAIAQQAWGEFRRQLTYKALWARKRLVVVNRYFASSKRCSRCHATKSSLCLRERTFSCPLCGLDTHRDVNAAMNLAQVAQQLMDASPEDRGKDKMPELGGLGLAASVTRGPLPRRRPSASAGSREGTARR